MIYKQEKEMAKFEVQSQCEATLELEAHEAELIKLMLENFIECERCMSIEEQLGLFSEDGQTLDERNYGSVAKEILKALEDT